MKVESVERGFRKFCETWNNIHDILVSGAAGEMVRFTFLNKRFNCEVKDGDCFILTIRPGGAEVERGKDELAHATICMDERDWLNVLEGKYNIWSVMIAGRLTLNLNESQPAIMLGYIMQSFGLMGE